MTHINGACYAPWENIVKHHFNHHLQHIDVVRFDTVKHIKEEINPIFRWIYIILDEQKNTFSNLISSKHPWLNLLFLNFGYHNAHHHNMSCPWHELPELHTKLYAESTQNVLPLGHLIINYHRFRLSRLLGGQGELDNSGALNLAEFTGGVGVSLLTPVSY